MGRVPGPNLGSARHVKASTRGGYGWRAKPSAYRRPARQDTRLGLAMLRIRRPEAASGADSHRLGSVGVERPCAIEKIGHGRAANETATRVLIGKRERA